MKIIAYAYDADYHCVSCAVRDFSGDPDHEDAVDSESNSPHPIFETDEWYANDVYEGDEEAELHCGTCHNLIDRVEL